MAIVIERATRVTAPKSYGPSWVSFIPVNNSDLVTVTLEMTSPPELKMPTPIYDTVSPPFRQAVNRWTGYSLENQVFTVMSYGAWNPDEQEQADVTEQVLALRYLSRPAGGTKEPPLLRVDGPGVYGKGADERWQVESIVEVPGSLISRSSDGRIGQIEFTVTLCKWFPSSLVIVRSPAEKAVAANGGAAAVAAGAPPRTYVVVQGDTLSRIAQRQLGNANRWNEIASLNGLRDPNKVSAGQTLKLP